MRLAAVLALVILAGCAAPEPRQVLSAPVVLGDGPPPIAVAGDRSVEWWNASVDASGSFALELPVPARWDQPDARLIPSASAWALPRVSEGNGSAFVVTTHIGTHVEIRGEGSVHVTVRAEGVAEAGKTADEFLLARWSLTTPRARSIPIKIPPGVGVQLWYEAVSDRCERRALLASDGAALWGSDEARCA